MILITVLVVIISYLIWLNSRSIDDILAQTELHQLHKDRDDV